MSDTDEEIDNLAKHLAKQMRSKDVAIINQIKALDVLTRYSTAKKKNAGKQGGSVVNFNTFREEMQEVQKGKRNG